MSSTRWTQSWDRLRRPSLWIPFRRLLLSSQYLPLLLRENCRTMTTGLRLRVRWPKRRALRRRLCRRARLYLCRRPRRLPLRRRLRLL